MNNDYLKEISYTKYKEVYSRKKMNNNIVLL